MKNKKAVFGVLAAVVVCVAIGAYWQMSQKGTTYLAKQLESSVFHTEDAVSFTIPQNYTQAEGWQLHVAGRAVYEDGFSQSLHYFEGEEWVAGKTYSIPVGEETKELILTVNRPGLEETTLDLLA